MGYSNLFVVVIWGIQHSSFLHWTTIFLTNIIITSHSIHEVTSSEKIFSIKWYHDLLKYNNWEIFVQNNQISILPLV